MTGALSIPSAPVLPTCNCYRMSILKCSRPFFFKNLSATGKYRFSATVSNEAGFSSAPSAKSFSISPTWGNPDSACQGVACGEPPTTPSVLKVDPGDEQAFVYFDVPNHDGCCPIVRYVATAHPGGSQGTSESPLQGIIVPHLTNGVEYTFTVVAENKCDKKSGPSNPSKPVIPRCDRATAGLSCLIDGQCFISAGSCWNEKSRQLRQRFCEECFTGHRSQVPSSCCNHWQMWA